MENPFDRAAESLGNVTFLEHLNVEIPNQGLASDFYLTRINVVDFWTADTDEIYFDSVIERKHISITDLSYIQIP